jgi:tetratricopeptide (TPR) repeat protein
MPCLDDRAVHAWIGGDLPETERDLVRTHLDSCDSCRELIASAVEGQWIGQTAGRYRLVELIGAGAMGEVYRAEDPELGRSIAIKIVHPGGSEKRLLREAQVMARLEHANVIRIYDVGMFGERVFLAMELVKGRTLRAWFSPSRSWRDVIATMKQAGSGLAAAHAAGLVHGDFKPDNVLVADDGRVLVTDFGLARLATEASTPSAIGDSPLAHTQTRGTAGTPAYMAPEQLSATAPASAASDQFGFCVTLFEGLYGARPFRGVDVRTLRTALEHPFVVPAKPALPRRLVRVLRRGLSSSAADRYPAMTVLLGELERATSRRRALVAGGAALLGSGVVATALLLRSSSGPACEGTAELDGVWDAGAKAKLEHAFRATDLPYATTSAASVGQLLDRYRDAWVATYTETCEATHVRGAQSEALLDLRMQCLRRRRTELKAIVDTLGAGDRDVLRDGVAAATALPSVSACADVASLQEIQALPGDPDARARIEQLETEIARCRALAVGGRYREATPCATAAAKTAGELKHEPAIAEAELTVGQIQLRLRNWAEAEAAYTRALLAAETGRDARTRARILTGLMSIAGERATFEQGRARLDLATAVTKSLDSPELSADLAMAAGVFALREGKFEVAIETLKRCVAIREQLHGKEDGRIAEALVPMAVAYVSRGKPEEGSQLLDRAIKLESAMRGDSHPAVGKTLHALAQIQVRMGKTDDALASQKRSFEILRAAYGDEHADVAQSIGAEAQIKLIAGRYAEAAAPARRSAELMEKIAGPDHPDTAVALATLAATLARGDDTKGALAANQRALAIRLKALGPDHLHTTQSQVSTAMGLRIEKRCDEALVLLEAARATRLEQLAPDHPDVLRIEQSMADCHVDLGHPDQAVPLFERALASREKTPRRTADDKVGYAMVSYGLARALWATPDKPLDRARATTLAKRAYADLTAMKDKRAEGIATWAKPRRFTLD